MINKVYLIEVNQPIGSFYVGKMNAIELIKISKTVRRDQSKGIQRELSESRAKGIMKYCEDPDAAFPTPIILSIIDSKESTIMKTEMEGIFEFIYTTDEIVAEILDGQHRIEGIKLFNNFDYDLPIVVMSDLTEEEKAYVFSTINSNQKSVDKSLIYDLFELSEKRSPYKTCHEIARILNSSSDSPFYRRLKMLGKKASDRESLSQGTFVTELCRLISQNPKKDMIDIKNGNVPADDNSIPFRRFFLQEKDEVILKILENYFNAIREVFYEEWENPEKYILSKTIGYTAFMTALKDFIREGAKNKDLSKTWFVNKILKFKYCLFDRELELTSNDFPSNAHMVKKLAELIVNEVW